MIAALSCLHKMMNGLVWSGVGNTALMLRQFIVGSRKAPSLVLAEGVVMSAAVCCRAGDFHFFERKLPAFLSLPFSGSLKTR